MDNFDLKKYLSEGRLFKENVDFPELEDEFEGAMDAMVVEPKVYLQDIIDASAEEIVSDDYYEIMNAVEQGVYSEVEAVKLAKAWAKEKLSNLAEGKLFEEEMSLDAFLKNQLTGIEGETEGMETVEKKEWLDMFGGTKNESGFDDIYNLIKNGKRSHSIDFGDFKSDYSFELGKNKIIIKYKIAEGRLFEKKGKDHDGEIISYIADTYIQNAKDGDKAYAEFRDLNIRDAVQDVVGILQDPKHPLHGETKKEYRIVSRDKARGLFEEEGQMDNFDLRKYLAEGKLNENEDDSYYIDEIKRDLEELDDKEANEYLEDLAKAILKLKR